MKKGRYYIDREFVMKVAQRIKELREGQCHTQEYLIEKVHLSINEYEVGNKVPTLMSILKICKFYNITLDEFFAPMKYPEKK
ncbi:MAG: helix-turn-helix transcriptional regulator [Alistipes sp.]|nr:helix-turn-helix transcriptional regulator [Alistipes sp.]MBS6460138.1 helix-turn-helix transcriptional regulator [Alistipes sp.]